MCFGPVASFTASAVLFSMGGLIARTVRERKEIFFVIFLFLFAAQQFIEGLVWLAIRNGDPAPRLHMLSLGFLLFAFCLWPVLCPISVRAIEPDPKKRKILNGVIAVGAIVSGYLLYAILSHKIEAYAVGCSVRYDTYVPAANYFIPPYVIAVVLPYFISSRKSILMFGAPNIVFFFIAYFFYNQAFISVWCFFAALISLSIYFFLRTLHGKPAFPFFLKPAEINS